MGTAAAVVELIGVASAAISGAMVAIEKKADVFGILFLALISALGGGIMRDILLGYFPPRMFTSYSYLLVVFVSAMAVFLDAFSWHERYHAHKDKLDQTNNLFDAIGLASFTVVGMDAAIASYALTNPVLIVSMGVVTGVGGGLLRDVLTNTMPRIFVKRIYAVASLLGAGVYYVLLILGAPTVAGAVVSMASVISLRFLATKYKWNLPHAEP